MVTNQMLVLIDRFKGLKYSTAALRFLTREITLGYSPTHHKRTVAGSLSKSPFCTH
jgi:hypothetical protein